MRIRARTQPCELFSHLGWVGFFFPRHSQTRDDHNKGKARLLHLLACGTFKSHKDNNNNDDDKFKTVHLYSVWALSEFKSLSLSISPSFLSLQ